MNKQELQMLDSLRELKEVYGVYGIKAEFEALLKGHGSGRIQR